MKNLIAIAIVLATLTSGCTRIAPSFAGVKVDNWASDDKGAITSLGRGTVWYNPFTEDIYEFPLHLQQQTYSEVDGTGLSVRSGKDNTTVGLDVALSYQFSEVSVSKIFQKYRVDPEALAAGYIYRELRSALNQAASEYAVMDILGAKLNDVQAKAGDILKSKLASEGIIIDQVLIVGKPRIDESIEKAINQTLQAVQEANREEQKVRQVTAQANQRIEQARGIAEATLLQAKAEAEAARLLAQELNPLVLQNHALSKWNGILPQMMTGSATPMITIPTGR